MQDQATSSFIDPLVFTVKVCTYIHSLPCICHQGCAVNRLQACGQSEVALNCNLINEL